MKRIFAATVLLSLLLAGCAKQETQPASTQPEVTSAPTTEVTTQPTTEATTQPPETEPPAPVYHSGLREDGSFDAGTLFIGDSETYLFLNQYLMTENHLGGRPLYRPVRLPAYGLL